MDINSQHSEKKWFIKNTLELFLIGKLHSNSKSSVLMLKVQIYLHCQSSQNTIESRDF